MRKTFIYVLLVSIALLSTTSVVFAQVQKTCPPGELPFRPGGECASSTMMIQGNIGSYPLTCQDIPTVRYKRSTYTPTDPGVLPVTVTEDLSQAELGGLGPSAAVYKSNNSSALSRYYPFSALFDKPLSQIAQSRESSQTFWRMMTTYDQANAKAKFLNRVRLNNPPINNSSVVYYSPNPPAGTQPTVPPTPTPEGGNSDILGFNWGYGHLNPQACKDAAGKPVTYLLPLTAGTDMIKQYKDCFAGASKQIIRITEITGATTDQELRSAAANFNAAAGSEYVELGNELNNLSAEYTGCSGSLSDCGANYARQFSIFRATFKGKLSAAALDTSNSDYDAAQFIAGAKSAYQSSDFTAANSYEGAGGCGQRCSKDSYHWLQQAAGVAKPVILTEFGLAPGKDTNLTEVINFYKNNLPSDVIAVTPLIRNPCSSAVGQWLRLVNGRLYDSENSLVNPTDCSTLNTGALYENSLTYLELFDRLPACLKSIPVCEKFIDSYKLLDLDTKAAYDALFPFNFDNVRGYEVLNDGWSKENLPYVRAIFDGLLSNQFGILNALSPDWVNGERDKKMLPTAGIPVEKEGELKSAVLARGASLDEGDCTSHDDATWLQSPLTYPNNTLSQVVQVPYTVRETTEIDQKTGLERTKYHLSGEADGNATAILNNPIQENLNLAIYKGKQSLINTLMPGWVAADTEDRDMVAPLSVLSTTEDGVKIKTQTLGLGRSTLARIGGELHTALCKFRNKWLIPKSFQDKTIDCEKMNYDQFIAQYYVPDDEAGEGGGGFTADPCRRISPAEVASCAYPTKYELKASDLQSSSFLFSCKEADRIARGVTGPGVYDVCCPSLESKNNTYAVKAAVCGNAAEINPSCAHKKGTAGNFLFCWGNNYRSGDTDSQFPTPQEGRKAYGDLNFTDCFKYNGKNFCPEDFGSDDINVHWCDSNNIYCGG